MKKLIFAFTSLLVLASCGDEVINETIDSEKEIPNSIKSIDPSIPYESPYGVTTCCSLVSYRFINQSDLDFNFEAFVGLARFDGTHNNFHNSWGHPLSNSSYPNLIANNNNEYFRLVKCNPIAVTANSVKNWLNSPQLPINNGMNFSIASTSTNYERAILHEYGKMYSFNIVITDPNYSNSIVQKTHLRFPFLPSGVIDPSIYSGDWQRMPLSANPIAEQEDLWFNIHTNEICVGNDYINFPGGGDGLNNKPSELQFHYNGKDYLVKAFTTATDVVISLEEI